MTDIIEHHGVKGMKWGVRNEDRPTGKERSSKPTRTDRRDAFKEAKASALVARANKANVTIKQLKAERAALPKGPAKEFERLSLDAQIRTLQTGVERDRSDAEAIRSGHLTSTQKKVLIGAAVVGGLVVGGYLVSKHSAALNERMLGLEESVGNRRYKSNVSKYGEPFRRNDEFAAKDLDPQGIVDKVCKGANPNYSNQGGHMNCRRCTFAYELRRRGFDVTATPSPVGLGQNETGLVNALIRGDQNVNTRESMSAFAGLMGGEQGLRTRAARGDVRKYTAHAEEVKDIARLRDVLRKQPNGARGECAFNMGGFGHSMAYEVINGEPHIFDTQKAEHFPVNRDGLNKLMTKWGIPRNISITRLDNVDLDMEFLNQWAESR